MHSILVTGGAGFIGSNLVESLLKRDDVGLVRVLDDLSTGYWENVESFKEILNMSSLKVQSPITVHVKKH